MQCAFPGIWQKLDILALASSLAWFPNPKLITKSLGCGFWGFFLGLPTCLEGRLVPAEPERCCGRCQWWHCPHGVLGDRLAALCGGLSTLTACSTAPSRNVQYSAWGLGSAVQLGTFPSGTLGVFKMISQIFLIFLVFFGPGPIFACL